jgi:hypothetical protein
MLKFLLIFLISSSTSFTATTLLEKHRTSGYVMPEHTFRKECKIYKEGYMESVTEMGDGTALGFSNQVSQARIKLIEQLLKMAKTGAIKERPYPCDVGNNILKGYDASGELIELDIAIDCGKQRKNQHMVLPILTYLAEELCFF